MSVLAETDCHMPVQRAQRSWKETGQPDTAYMLSSMHP